MPRFRQLVILATIAISLFYLVYRVAFTLNFNTTGGAILSVSLITAEAFGITSVLLFSLQVWDPREPAQMPVLPGRTVDVFVPTYNEDPMILRATLEACTRLDYPGRQVYLCDDGGTDQRINHPENGPKARERQAELKAICAELGVTYLTRPKNEHAKAGNLNHAFTQTDGEFIIIFDADHVPEPHFITRLIGYFADAALGYIQTPHAFYNFNSFQARLDHKNRKYWEEGALFYGVIQPGRNRWNCPIFAGSAAMFRRKALEEVGYIALETITEDMHTGMRMNAKGWKSLAISERMVAGQAAPDITTFHTQRLRWGEGNLSIMAYDNPVWMKGLTFSQRLCYLGSMIHWAGGIFKLVIYLTPVVMMLTGVSPVREFTWPLFTITAVYMFASIFGVQYMSNGYGSVVYGELFAIVNFWTQIRGTSRAIFWRKFQQFVVTSKRGTQSKSVWPFVRPQIAIFLVSFFALVWGWARLLYGISDDHFKPIIPTCWLVFHMILIGMAVRRAMWPSDGRYSFRHTVNVVVRYESADGVVGAGVTIDLNELGLGMVGFQPAQKGAKVRLRIDGAGEVIECGGTVMWVVPAVKAQGVPGQAFRIGVKFDPVPGPVFDAINRVTLQYGVPRLYLEYAEGNRQKWLARVTAAVRHKILPHRLTSRRGYKLPVQVVRSGGEPVWTVTEDLTPTAVAVLLNEPLAPRTDVGLTLISPVGEVYGRARVLRSAQGGIGAKTYYRTVLEFHHLHGDGPNTLQDLISRPVANAMADALVPDPKPLPIPTLRPAAYAALAACLLIGIQMATFPLAYRNELFLRDFAMAKDADGKPLPPTPDEVARFDAIYTASLEEGTYPSNDRLVLLMDGLTRVYEGRTDDAAKKEKKQQQDAIAWALANRDRYNMDLAVRKLDIRDSQEDYAGAEREYAQLQKLADDGYLDATQRREMLLSGARTAAHASKQDSAMLVAAVSRFRQYLTEFPNDPPPKDDDLGPRDEFAGLLLSLNHPEEVPAIYQGITPRFRGQLLLMSAYARMGKDDPEMLTKALGVANEIRKSRPDDEEALALMSEILLSKGSPIASAEILEKIVAKNTNTDPAIGVKLGEVYLGDTVKRYPDALVQFQRVLENKSQDEKWLKGMTPDLRWRAQQGLINAAAAIPNDLPDRGKYLNDGVRKLAEGITEQTELQIVPKDMSPTTYAEWMTRLAYVLERYNLTSRAITVLERARGLTLPADAPSLALRKKMRDQLFGDLVAVDKVDQALTLMDPDEQKKPENRKLIISAYLKKGDLDKAEKEAQALQSANPEDLDAKRTLADILSWNKRFDLSLSYFEELKKNSKYKNPPDLPPVPVRIAEVTLWSAAGKPPEEAARVSAKAAKLYEDLLTQKFDQKELWPGFVDAVSGSTVLDTTRKQQQLAVQIAQQEPVLAGKLEKSALKNLALVTRLAWVLTRQGKAQKDKEPAAQLAALAAPLVKRAVELAPDVRAPFPTTAEGEKEVVDVKRELAGVLAASDRPAEALTLYEGIHPRTVEDQGRLADIYSHPQIQDWPAALEAAREYVKSFPTEYVGRMRVANILSWWKKYPEALAEFRKLNNEFAGDLEILVRIAEVTLWSQDFATAFDQFAKLLTQPPTPLAPPGPDTDGRPNLTERMVTGFTDAASGLLFKDKKFTDAQLATIKEVRQKAKFAPTDAKQLSRLAYVLFVAGGGAEAAANPLRDEAFELARQAVALEVAKNPKDPDNAKSRKELAGVLAAMQDFEPALKLYDGLDLTDPKDKLELASLYMAAGAKNKDQFKKAEAVLKDYTGAVPDDVSGWVRLAKVYSYQGRFGESLALFENLQRKFPTDPEIPVRIAEVTLWGGDPDKALALFTAPLAANFNQPLWWPGFIDAAAAATVPLTPGQVAIGFKIFDAIDQRAADLNKADWTTTARVARTARVLAKGNRAVEAGKEFDRAVAMLKANPQPADRREVAGLLTASDRVKEALDLYKDVRVVTDDDRRTLVWMYGTDKNFKAAIEQAKTLADSRPQDEAAKRLLADTYSWAKDNSAARGILDPLRKAHPADLGLLVRTAEVTLYAGLTRDALALFTDALAKPIPDPKVLAAARTGFVDAAAAAAADGDELTPAQTQVAVAIADDPATVETAEKKDVPYLSRLAWVLIQADRSGRADALLDRAEALAPTDDRVRKELAGVLAAAGRGEQARRLFGKPDPADPEDFRRLANIYVSLNQFAAATREAKAYEKARKGDPKAERLLADVSSWNGDFDRALALFANLRKKLPDDKSIPIRQAQTTLWANRPNEALALFTGILQKDPARRPAVLGFIASAFQADIPLPPDALKVAFRVKQDFADTSDNALLIGQLGYAFYRTRSAGPAVEAAGNELLDRAVNVVPPPMANTRDRTELGGILTVSGRPADAAKMWAGLPFNAIDQRKLAEIYTSVKDYPRAIEVCRGVLAANPGDKITRFLLANVYSYDRKYAAALAEFRDLQNQNPDDFDLNTRIAETYLWSGQPEKSLELFEAELVKEEQKKEDVRPKTIRGLIEAAAGNAALTPAQAALVRRLYADEPITRDILEAGYQVRLGRALELANMPDEAREVLDAVARTTPEEPRVRKDVAAVLAAAGRQEDAFRLLAGLRIDPADYEQFINLAAGRKAWTTAETAAEDYMKAFPDDPKAKRMLADVYSWWGDGHYDKALALFRELEAAGYKDADPKAVSVPVRIAETTLWSGKTAEAMNLFAALVAKNPDDPAVQEGFLAAVAGYPDADLPPAAREQAGRVVGRLNTARMTDPAKLARVAQVYVKLQRKDEARRLLTNRAVKLPLTDPATRREVAGALAAADLPKDGLALFKEPPTSPADKELVADLYAADKQWEPAEKLLTELRKADPGNERLALRLAAVLAGAGKYNDAADLSRELLAKKPGDVTLAVRTGQIELAAKRWTPALRLFAGLLPDQFGLQAARKGFVDAAAAPSNMTADDVKLAVRLAADPITLKSSDVQHLGRLAWVLIREGVPGNADALLDRAEAIALTPATDLAARRELAGVLAAANRGERGLKLFDLGNPERKPEDHYSLANIYASVKKFREAIAECREYLKTAPNDFRAELLLANLHSWNRDFDEALVEFDRLKAKYPDDKAIPVRMAETTLWAKRPDEALDQFTALLSADPNQPKAVPGFIGSAVEADALTPEAVAAAERLAAGLPTAPEQLDPRAALAGGAAGGWLALAGSDPLQLARLGYVFRQARQPAVADRLFADAVAAVPAAATLRNTKGVGGEATTDARVRSETAAMLDIAGRPDDAAAMRAGLPFDAANLYATAQVYASVNGFKAAIAELQTILAREPGNRAAQRLLADCLTWDRQFPPGLALLNKLLAESPGDPDLPARIAQTYVWDNKPELAIVRYRAELKKDPGRPKLVRGLIEAAAAMGSLSKADAALVAQAYKEVPILQQITEPVFVAQLGRALQLAGLTADADKELERAIANPPRSGRGRADLAAVLADAGRADAALKLLESIAPEPGDFARLTATFAGKKDWPSAERAARAYAAAYPNDLAAVRQLADVLSWWGGEHRQEALALFAKLVAADPADADARLRQAEVKLWTGDSTGAVPGFLAAIGGRSAAAVAGTAAAPGWWGQDPARRADAATRAVDGFAAAAAGADPLPAGAADLAARMLADPVVQTKPLMAGRLTTVLFRAGRPLPAGVVERFLAAAPQLARDDPDQRREVAGLLSALGKPQAGLDLFARVKPDPTDRPLLAGLYLAAKQYENAQREAMAILNADPSDPVGQRLMADVLAGQNDFKAARERYLKLLESRPRDIRLLMSLARMDMAMKQWEFAAARLATVLELDYDAAQAKAEFVNAAAAAKRLTEDQVALATRIAEDPETMKADATHLARLAWVLIREKAPGPVHELLAQAVALDPTSLADRKELAGVLAADGQGELALEKFGSGPPESPEDHFLLANIQATRKDYAPALLNAREYLRLRPEDPEWKGHRLLADLLSFARFFDESLTEFDALRKKLPDDKSIPVRVAETTLWDDRAADALDQFTRILAADPNQSKAIAGFVNAAFAVETIPPEALAVALKVRAALRSGWTGAGPGAGALAGGWAVGKADDPLVLARLGYLFHKADRDDLADPLFVRAALIVPRGTAEPLTRWELGGILDVADWSKLADEVWAGLATPAEPEDRYKLALVYAAVRDFDSAIEISRDILRTKPDFRKGERLLADCLTWNREYREGLERLEKLLVETPDDPDLPARIAQTLVWAGRPEKALDIYRAELLKHWGRPKLVRGMVEAAAAMTVLPKNDATLIVKAYQEFKDSPVLRRVANPVFVARLGRALQLAGLPADADRELDAAEKAAPRGERDRQDLAGVLADAGRADAALKLFEGLPPALRDYRRLAYLYVGKDWPAAVKAARASVAANPNDPTAVRTLADILSWWGGEHRQEALVLLNELATADRADPGLKLRIAEVQLWERNNAGAIPGFAAVLAGRAAAAVVGAVADPDWDATAGSAPLPGDLVTRAAKGFAAAVGRSDGVSAPAVDLAAGLLRDWPGGTIDPLAAGQLAVALTKARRPVPPGVVERFVAAAPEFVKDKPDERREVAGLLGALNLSRAGLDLFRGVAPTPADAQLLAGLFLAAKDYPAAEQQAKAWLVAYPGDPIAERLLADVLAAKGDYKAAAETYERLVAADPNNPKLLFGLGRLYQAQNLPDQAAARLSAALGLDYDSLEIRAEFVNAVAGLPVGRLTDAEMTFAVRVAEDPATLRSDKPIYLTRLAYVLAREKAPGPINALLDRAVALNPQDPQDRKELAGVLAFAERPKEALTMFGEVRPDHPEDRITLANILSALNDFPAAIREVLAYLAAKPGDRDAELLLANLRSYNGEFDEALAALDALLMKDPTSRLLPIRIAETTLWSGRAAEALARFTRILAADINQPQAVAGFVAAAFQVAPIPADSLAIAEKVRAMLAAGWVGGGTPAGAVGGVLAVGRYDSPLLLARLGYVLSKAGKPAEADPLFARAALQSAGDDGRVRWELGGVLDVAGKPAEAQAVWAGLPFQAAGRYQLAQVYAAVRDFPRAVEEARKILDREPDNRRAKRLLADCLTWNKDWDAGLVLLRELQRQSPDDPDLTARIAETLVWAGKPADALLTYSEALRRYWGRPKLVRGFVEALANLPADARPSAADLDLLNRIVREFPALGQSTDPVFAARFARALQAAGRTDEAARLFDRVLAGDLTDPRVRRALAPLLAAGGRVADAERMFQGLTPEPDDYPQLAYLFVGRKNWAEAERFARLYLAAFPNDPKAPLLLADVLGWWGGVHHAESLAIFDKLLQAKPGDKGLLLRSAEVRQWSGDNVRATGDFLALIKAGGLTDAELTRARDGFLTAAAGAAAAAPTGQVMAAEYADLAEQIARTLPPASPDGDPLRPARAAVILTRANRTADVPSLVARATAVPAGRLDPAARKDLAGLFAALKRWDDAVALYRSLPDLTLEDRVALAGMYSAAERFAEAEREARAAIDAAPKDPRAARLLANVLSWKKDYTDAIKAYTKLIAENPEDLDLKRSLAQVLLYAGKYTESADAFAPLLDPDPNQYPLAADFIAAMANVNEPKTNVLRLVSRVAKTPTAQASTDPTFLANMAWVLRRSSDRAEGEKYLDRAYALASVSADPTVRKNLAGVLETYGKKKEAIALFRGLDLTAGDRLRLAGLYAAEAFDDKTSYDPTIEQCRTILVADPNNLRAKRLLADALGWNAVREETPAKAAAEQFKESLALFRELAAVGFVDKDADKFVGNTIRIAEVTLWSKAFDAALVLYRNILTEKFEQGWPELTVSVWDGFSDAAASSKKPTAEDRALARRIADRVIDDPKTPVVRLSRLAWVLLPSDPTRAKDLLDVAVDRVAKTPTPPAVRRELAGVLASPGAGRYAEARAMYDPLELTYEDKLRVAQIFVAESDFASAEKRIRAMLKEKPNDPPTKLLLADVLTWNKKYPEAIRMLEAMRDAEPTNAAVLGRLATVYLYSGDPARSLALLNPLLTDDLDQPDLWGPYLDAIGASNGLADSYQATVDRVIARLQATKGDTPDVLRLIGGALARSGRAERAIAVLRPAVAASPNNQALRERYADVLSLSGRFTEAAEQYEIILRQNNQRRPGRPAPPPAVVVPGSVPTDANAGGPARPGRPVGTTVARPR